MRARASGTCPQPGCPNLKPCPVHHHDRRRPNAATRGYDQRWRQRRASFLRRNPTCVDCGNPSTDADHAPRSRAQLTAAGVTDPDADQWLQARCHSCHSKRTVAADGGFGRGVG